MPNKQQQNSSSFFAIALVVAVGGLIYELILGTASSYLFGDSIVSFSLSIGFSLFGMGLGSLLSQRFLDNSLIRFIQAELILSFLGGLSVIILFGAFSLTKLYWLVFVCLTVAIGVCVGLEIPLIIRTFSTKSSKQTAELLSKVLALDYIGALIASLVFPFVLLPYLGLIRTALAVGLLNLSVVLYLSYKNKQLLSKRILRLEVIALIVLAGWFIFAHQVERTLTVSSFSDPVVHYDLSPYQRIVVTKYKDDTRLYLNNQLQFSSLDESRYHETLAHNAMTRSKGIKQVLVLGGGDGLMAREILRYPEVDRLTIVDLDPKVTQLASSNRLLKDLNNDSMQNPRVTVINQDAFVFSQQTKDKYDVIIADLVDPANERTAKLYSVEFYQNLQKHLNDGGIFTTQASSSFFTPKAFWSINASIAQAFPHTAPFSVNVPSFGEWGFVLASTSEISRHRQLPSNLRYLTTDKLDDLADSIQPEVAAARHDNYSTLINPKVYLYYNKDMEAWSY